MKNFNFNENKDNKNNNNNEKLFNWEEQAKLDSQQSFREQQKQMIDNLRNENDNNRLENKNDNNLFNNRNDNNKFDNKDNKKIKRDNNQNNFK